MGNTTGLRHGGFLNEEWSYEDLIAKQRVTKLLAICTSYKCSGNNFGGRPKFKAKLTDIECKQCGSVLKWKKLTFEQYEKLRERF